jgi:hypothetical protein
MYTVVDLHLVDARLTVLALLCRKVCRFGGEKCEKQEDFGLNRIPIGSVTLGHNTIEWYVLRPYIPRPNPSKGYVTP